MVTHKTRVSWNFIDLTGGKFGRLTVIKRGLKRGKHLLWNCKCICGKLTSVYATHLIRGNSLSCGCLKGKGNRTHGDTKTRLFRIWMMMKTRCSYENSNRFTSYGGRGIKVCKRWMKFEKFRDDMHKSYLQHCRAFGVRQTTIERKDVNKGYTPSNCTWATYKEQARNKRNIKLYTYRGKSLCLSAWAEKMEINLRTVWGRINVYEWPFEKAISTPTRK